MIDSLIYLASASSGILNENLSLWNADLVEAFRRIRCPRPQCRCRPARLSAGCAKRCSQKPEEPPSTLAEGWQVQHTSRGEIISTLKNFSMENKTKLTKSMSLSCPLADLFTRPFSFFRVAVHGVVYQPAASAAGTHRPQQAVLLTQEHDKIKKLLARAGRTCHVCVPNGRHSSRYRCRGLYRALSERVY